MQFWDRWTYLPPPCEHLYPQKKKKKESKETFFGWVALKYGTWGWVLSPNTSFLGDICVKICFFDPIYIRSPFPNTFYTLSCRILLSFLDFTVLSIYSCFSIIESCGDRIRLPSMFLGLLLCHCVLWSQGKPLLDPISSSLLRDIRHIVQFHYFAEKIVTHKKGQLLIVKSLFRETKQNYWTYQGVWPNYYRVFPWLLIFCIRPCN